MRIGGDGHRVLQPICCDYLGAPVILADVVAAKITEVLGCFAVKYFDPMTPVLYYCYLAGQRKYDHIMGRAKLGVCLVVIGTYTRYQSRS